MNDQRPARVLTFQLAETPCALCTEEIQEVVEMAELSRPPGLPSCVEGMLTLDREAVPVIRLDRLLQLPEIELGLSTLLIVARVEEQKIALPVDRVDDVRPVEYLAAYRDRQAMNRCTEGELTIDGVRYHLLRAGTLLLKEEQIRVAEFREREQKRIEELELAVVG